MGIVACNTLETHLVTCLCAKYFINDKHLCMWGGHRPSRGGVGLDEKQKDGNV